MLIIAVLVEMEEIIKTYQQKFRKVKAEMNRWDEIQSKLVSQFCNASSIIENLQIIQNYGVLKCIDGIEKMVVRKQMQSLTMIFQSTNQTMDEFHSVVQFLEKSLRDGRQLVSGASEKKLQQRIGMKPTIADCLDGLSKLHEMHDSEYRLKSSMLSTLSKECLKKSITSSDLSALQQVLVDQPNIPKEEVERIFDIIFAEEI